VLVQEVVRGIDRAEASAKGLVEGTKEFFRWVIQRFLFLSQAWFCANLCFFVLTKATDRTTTSRMCASGVPCQAIFTFLWLPVLSGESIPSGGVAMRRAHNP
jgi:hypothetical protein